MLWACTPHPSAGQMLWGERRPEVPSSSPPDQGQHGEGQQSKHSHPPGEGKAAKGMTYIMTYFQIKMCFKHFIHPLLFIMCWCSYG